VFKFFKKTRWLQFEDVMKDYPDGTYEVCDLGIRTVNSDDIIGLGLLPEEIANDEKMKRLRESVDKNGWKDEHPMDLHLYLTPKGKYTVCSGGNHRPYLANELKIPQIEAIVDVVIPKDKISNDSRNKIEEMRGRYKNVEDEAKNLNKFLVTQGIKRSYEYKEDDERFRRMCDQLDELHESINNTLIMEAIKLGYITSSWEN
jgi:hypothetical protein